MFGLALLLSRHSTISANPHDAAHNVEEFRMAYSHIAVESPPRQQIQAYQYPSPFQEGTE
jgi:hypothetical protein